MKRFLLLLLLVFLSSFKPASDCKSFFNGKFIYEQEAYKGVHIQTSSNKHVEYYNHGENFIESKKEYIDDCTFKLTVKKVKMPTIGLKVGDVMYVKVHSLENDKLTISAEMDGLSPIKIKLIKIQE